MIWTLRPQLGDMVERMIRGAYHQSVLPPEERELARMRIAQINDCIACSDTRRGNAWRSSTPNGSRSIMARGLGRSLSVLGVDQYCAIDV